MQKYIPVLRQTRLFAGISENEIAAMLDCLQAKSRRYKKGEYIFRQGEHLDNVTVVVKGSLLIQNNDYWGNRSIVNTVSVGEVFGEAYAASDSGAMPNDAVAAEDSAVVFLDVKKLLTVCSSGCKFHTLVIQNMFFTLSEKNRKLMQKLGHISKRSTREKLISFLSEEAKRQSSKSFSISFNRQQLADYLSVDRSAMSKELCRMRDEGLLIFEKNKFTLL
ncbi:MAG: Crp/Fnr family transcriptional regulator [Oscillospiraceae bacterium]|nr:Crp/Fnr family transcriptional regulator [Oscillospiraceae bacterium]